MCPLNSPRSTIQSASTPPPSPPMARIAILRGWAAIFLPRSERELLASARIALLQPADHRAAHPLAKAVPARRVGNDLRLVERRTQHGGMGNLAAQAAADAAVDHGGDRIGAQRVGVRLDRQRRAAV